MLPAPLHGYAQQVIWRIPFQVVLPGKHPLATRRSFELTDLQARTSCFHRESRPEFYDEFFRHCANANFVLAR